LQKGFNEICLSKATLSKGMYLMVIDDKEGVYNQMLIKE